MDVRQNIKNQKKRVGIITIIPIIAFALLMQLDVINNFFMSIRPSLIVPTLIVLYSGFYGYMVDKIKCPSCDFKFHNLSVKIKIKNKHQVNVCPHFSISLDTDLKTPNKQINQNK